MVAIERHYRTSTPSPQELFDFSCIGSLRQYKLGEAQESEHLSSSTAVMSSTAKCLPPRSS